MSTVGGPDARDEGALPVTLSIRRTVHAGSESAYKAELAAVLGSATQMPGARGASVLARAGSPAEYDIRLHFASQEAMDGWIASDTRRLWLERLDELSDGAVVEKLGAQDAWLVQPDEVIVRLPPRYKVALLTWVGIYPIITCLLLVAGPRLEPFPVAVRSLFLTAVLIPLMTWVVMPFITRVTAGWLHAPPRTRIRTPRHQEPAE